MEVEDYMSKPTLNIDGMTVEFDAGQTILEVARSAGIHTIPTLCYLKDTTATGSCRMCMVEVEGARTLLAACATAANKGMVIRTESPRIDASRKMVLELLMTSGNHNCKECEANGVCELQALGSRYLVTPIAMNVRWHVSRILQTLGSRQQAATHSLDKHQDTTYGLEDSNDFIRRDFSRCIKCGRCVRACNEKQVNRAISIGYRGSHNKIVTRADSTYDQSDCVSCGECVQACPVGALVEKKSMGLAAWAWETQKVRTTCPHCGVGCQLWLHVKDDKIVKVTGVEDAAPNQGRLCVKGRFGYDYHLLRGTADDAADQDQRRVSPGLLGRGPGPGGRQVRRDHQQTRN